MAKIAVVNVPYGSHTEAAIRLTSVLARQGHQVVTWGRLRYREQIEAAGARFELHEPKMPSVNGVAAHVAAVAALAEQTSQELIDRLVPHRVDVLVHDSLVLWARVAGDYLGLPRVIAHPMFPIIAPYSIPARPRNPRTAPDPVAARRRFEASQRSIAHRWGVELEGIHDVIHSQAPTTVAFTTPRILGDFELAPGWHCVGPLMTPAQPAVSTRARALVYVCFGTAHNRRPELFGAVLRALADEPVDVVVSTGGGTVSAHDAETLAPNVTLRDLVLQREVLARATVHITHGGCNSVHESLLAGVPMVCIPQAFDQFPLSRRLELLGAGLVVNERPTEIREAVRMLLASGKARARARALGEHLAHYDGEGRVSAMIDRVLVEDPVART